MSTLDAIETMTPALVSSSQSRRARWNALTPGSQWCSSAIYITSRAQTGKRD